MLQVIRSPKVYDVCIIGSGAAGGMAAKVLAEGGLNVVMLEAGPDLDPARDYKEHVMPYELERRGAGIGGAAYTDFGHSEFLAPNGSWTIEGEPYVSAPGTRFRWFRSRILGGRTNHYGRISLRFSEADFRERSTDGEGDDWPINYQDVAPYYDKVDSYIGIFGSKEGLPGAPDGIFQPPPKPRCTDQMVKNACDKLGIFCIPARLAILTQPLNGRPACHYCDQCGRGCRTASNFSSSQVLIPPAAATGRFTLITGAMAREILVDQAGKASGVSYVDKATRTEQQVRARAFVVAASSCESTRLLLNSKSSLFPDGLANSSGVVGRFLMDTPGATAYGYVPRFEKMPPHNHDGVGGGHVYSPWWSPNHKNDFLRGYHIEYGGGRSLPSVGYFDGTLERNEGYGTALKRKCRQEYGAIISFDGRGAMIPNENCYCEIDPSVVDRWGIPVLRFHWKWGENEIRMVKHMHQTFQELTEAMGGTYLTRPEPAGTNPYGIYDGGGNIHELGTARMGSNPHTSALNGFCQAHDVKNLFVADGACFVSNPDKNPTLTITALSWRASDYLIEEARKGNL